MAPNLYGNDVVNTSTRTTVIRQGILATLRRVPPATMRRLANRRIEGYSNDECILGWLDRDLQAQTFWNRLRRRDAAHFDARNDKVQRMAKTYGGTEQEWDGIFSGIMWDNATVMAAFRDRLAETQN